MRNKIDKGAYFDTNNHVQNAFLILDIKNIFNNSPDKCLLKNIKSVGKFVLIWTIIKGCL